jgi:hypothetical protein
MPILVVGAEKSFAELAPRLFRGEVSAHDMQEVADAVREGNPHANFDDLVPGTVLTVPDSPLVRARDALSLVETTASIEALAEVATGTLEQLVNAAEAQEVDLRKERARALSAMTEIDSMVERPNDRRLTKDLASARKQLEEEDIRAKERAATLTKAQNEWVAGLAELKERISSALPTG